MSRIRLLPKDVISKIAAGEVIERPVSAVKELVENSLDAGATRIEVEVRGAPHAYISVEDNGCGMSAEEARLALKRHSTSKIATEDDLRRIGTLGFRGEALPSIAAVSKMMVSSQQPESPEGVRLKCEGGEILGEEAIAMSPGTRVEVRELFYNLPVRKRFLRSVETEFRHIVRFVEACALAHRRVFFRLLRDGAPVLTTPPARSLLDRALCLYGSTFEASLIEAAGTAEGVTVDAVVGKPEVSRSTRESMVFAINGRWVSSAALAKAVRDAYGDLLPSNRFPTAVVLVEMAPELVDANVHPAKREVKFSPRARVYDAVREVVARALSRHAPELWPEATARGGGEVVPAKQLKLETSAPRLWGGRSRRDSQGAGISPLEAAGAVEIYRGVECADEDTAAVALWQIHNRYVCGQTQGGLVIVDQHAAHERILYEAAVVALRENKGASQQLLFPRLLELSALRYDVLLEMLPYLEKLGFDIRSMSDRTVAVHGIPATAQDWRDGGLLLDMVDDFAAGGRTAGDQAERIAKSYACHAAVKAGQRLSREEMNALLDGLFATSVPHGDPHGRPTYLVISLTELEKRFGRSG